MSAPAGSAAVAAADVLVLDQATISKLLAAASQVDRLESLLARLERVSAPAVAPPAVVRTVAPVPAPPVFVDDSHSEVVEQLRVAELVSPSGCVTQAPRSQRHSMVAAAPAQSVTSEAALLARIAALEAQNRALQASADALRAQQHAHNPFPPLHPKDTAGAGAAPPMVLSLPRLPIGSDAASTSPPDCSSGSSGFSVQQYAQPHSEHHHADAPQLHPSAEHLSVGSDCSDATGGESSPAPSPSVSLYAKRSTRTASVEIQLFEAHMAQGLQQQQQQQQLQQKQKRGSTELQRHAHNSSTSPPPADASAASAASSTAASVVASAAVSPVLQTRAHLLHLASGGASPPTDAASQAGPGSSNSPVWTVSREPLDAAALRGDPPPPLRLQQSQSSPVPTSADFCAASETDASSAPLISAQSLDAPSWPAHPAATAAAGVVSASAHPSAAAAAAAATAPALPCPPPSKKAPFRLLRADSRQCEYSNVGDGRISLGVRSTNLVRLNWAPLPEPQPHNVLIIKKPGDAEVSQALYDVALWLHAHRKIVFVEPNVRVEECAGIAGLPFLQTWSSASTIAQLHAQIDLVVCLGGDGTLLWCSQLFPGAVPPVISFALGSLGFLSPFPLDSFPEALSKVFAGGFHLTLRSRLVCTIVRGGGGGAGAGAGHARSKRASAPSKRAAQREAAAAAAASAASAAAAATGAGAGVVLMPKTAASALPTGQAAGLSVPRMQRGATEPAVTGSELAAAEAEAAAARGSAAVLGVASSPDSAYAGSSERSASPPPPHNHHHHHSHSHHHSYHHAQHARTASHHGHAPPSLSVVRARHYSLSAQKPQGFGSVPAAYRSLSGDDRGAAGAEGSLEVAAAAADDATALASILSAPTGQQHDAASGDAAAAAAAALAGLTIVPPHSPSQLPRTATSSPTPGGDGEGELDPFIVSEADTAESSDVESYVCMNEVIIDRGLSAYLTQLDCAVDGMLFTRVQADGIIVATPTGSTAYSLSAGGSIVHTDVPLMLFTPVCPHSLSFRPLLFPDTSTLQIKINADSRGTNCASFDGRHRVTLSPGDSVLISMSRWPLPSICRLDGTSDWFLATNSVLQWNSRSASQKSFHTAGSASASASASAASSSSGAAAATAPKRSASHATPVTTPTPTGTAAGAAAVSPANTHAGHYPPPHHGAAAGARRVSISAPHPLLAAPHLADVRELDSEDSSASASHSAAALASELHSVSAPPRP